MNIQTRGNFKYAIVENLNEIQKDLAVELDWIELITDAQSIELSNHSYGTRYIGWQKKIVGEFEDSLAAKNAKNIMKAVRKAQKEGFRAEHYTEIPHELYAKWYKDIYLPFMQSKSKAGYIGPNWLDTDAGQLHRGIFLFDPANTIVGASYYYITKKGDTSFSYKSLLHDLAVDLNPLLENTAYDAALANKSAYIKKGIDYNLYGADLSTGLAKYKQKFGFSPINYIAHNESNPSYFRYLIMTNSSKLAPQSFTFTSNDINSNPILSIIN